MSRKILAMFLMLLLGSGLFAQEFSKMGSGEPELIQKGEAKAWCPVCGMSLKMYYKTSHGMKLRDGSAKQYCSMRCLAVDYPQTKENIAQILVVDAKSEKLIDAKKAFYVVGSKVAGTMSMVSKLGFADESDAKAFAVENGGEVVGFGSAFSKAQASLKDDVDEFIKKKQKGAYPMGEKIYVKQCQKEAIHLHNFKTISELKANIATTHVCGELEEKDLQALGLYLWEVKRFEEQHKHSTAIHVDADEKCPVCGMFVAKYPRWAARLSYQEDDKKVNLAFDGVKDLLKSYHNPSSWGSYTKHHDESLTILVSDYYTQEALDGKRAFYVVGSDVYGPMGKEFIPFSTLKSAQTFLKDHKGTEILAFSNISKELVLMQDK